MDLDTHLPAIARGDAAAFGRWLSCAEPPLRRSLASFAAQIDTEAVLQEALLRTWQVAPRLEPDGAGNSLLRLALRIARNCAISETRRTRFVNPEPAAEPEGLEPAMPDPMLREHIVSCREALPKKPALALSLRLESAGGASDRQLAARAHQTLDAFLQAVSRARKLLAECLQKKGVALSRGTP